MSYRPRKPGQPNRIMLLMPMGELIYGRVRAEDSRWWMWAVKHGSDILVDVIPMIGHGFPDPHNRALLAAMEHPQWSRTDYAVIVEQDHQLPTNWLARVANYREPIVGAYYVQRGEPHWPVSCVPKPGHWQDEDLWQGEGWTQERTAFPWPSLVQEWQAEGKLQRVLGIGMGMTAIRRDVLDSWPVSPPFMHPVSDELNSSTYDILFCRDARRRGWEVWQDFGMELPHLTIWPRTQADHVEALQRRHQASVRPEQA